MKRFVIVVFAFVATMAFNLWSPSKEIEVPFYFPKPVYSLPVSSLDLQRVELGRALFYDPILSFDSTISCASCHSPFHAFAHVDHAISHGIGDSIGQRNAPALFNLAWQKSFMWDGAINHLDMQALAPISHPDEMGDNMRNVISKLRKSALYKAALASCWPGEEWESFHVLRALSLFQSTLISNQSRYDAMRQGEVEFNAMETKGFAVYKAYCQNCHPEPLFTTGECVNNGLPLDSVLMDFGVYKIINADSVKGLFKIPSLRNWAFSKPYMHDGRFQRMQDVLHHYRHGVFNVLPSNTHMTKAIPMSDNESVELMAFLKTLNDSAFVFNPKFQFPKYFFQKANDSK